MSEKHEFAGTIIRIEVDGFGIVQFDQPIGEYANTLGVFSSTTSSSLPFPRLRPGVHVEGTAEADKHQLATVKTLRVVSPSV